MPVASNFVQSVGRQWWRQIPNFRGLPQKVPTQAKQLGKAVERDVNRLLATEPARATWVSSLRSHLQKILSKAEVQSLASGLRKRSAWQLMSGMHTMGRPLSGSARRWGVYAFVCVGLASGTQGLGQVADQEKFGGVFQQLFGKPKEENEDKDLTSQPPACIDDYELGSTIGKGCYGAVVEARLKTIEEWNESTSMTSAETGSEMSDSIEVITSSESIEVIDSQESSCSIEVIDSCQESSSSIEVIDSLDFVNDSNVVTTETNQLLDEVMAMGTNSQSDNSSSDCNTDSGEQEGDFQLAIKMMYNYGISSNEHHILNAMRNEILLAEHVVFREDEAPWQYGHPWKKQRLKPHPNVLQIQCAFVDRVPYVADSLEKYPASLPKRYNPDGCGRNSTLFLVMKKYPWTLSEYLHRERPDLRQSLLLQTQLLEAIAHLNKHYVAHRDIKTDNILLSLEGDCPQLVLGDFGCCLVSDQRSNFRVPYTSEHVSKGGNAALSAPEISTAQPGWRHNLDFHKSDVWAAGAIAYEVFGLPNPFYRRRGGQALDSRTYRDNQLPTVPEVPQIVSAVVRCLLTRDHTKRPDSIGAATMFELLLWAPHSWFTHSEPPSRSEVAQWLRSVAIQFMLDASQNRSSTSTSVEDCLKTLFLARLNMDHIYDTVCKMSSLVA